MSDSDGKIVDKDADADEKAIAKRNVADDPTNETKPNPPRTTTRGWFTAPKFGSAGSGGAELEPGPERD